MSVVLPVAVAACVFLAARLAFAVPRHSWVSARLAPHVGPRPVVVEDVSAAPVDVRAGLRKRLERAIDTIERRLAVAGAWRRFAVLTERAGVALRPGEVAVAAAAGAGFLVLLAVAGGSPALAVVLPPFVLVATVAWLTARAGRRRRAFEEQLAEVLGALSSSLKAGHSFSQALQGIAEDAEEPARSEFQRVLAEARLGRPLEEALEGMGNRIRSPELDFVLGAVTVQRQVGGSLAGLFETVADTVRQRDQFLRKVRALTAMGRMSAIVLVAMPFAVAALLTLVSPGYMSPLWTTGIGRLLVAGALVSVAIGAALLKQIAAVKG